MEIPEDAKEAAKFLWENRNWIRRQLRKLFSWVRTGEGNSKSPGILILGTGGSGKSTLARLLTGEHYDPLLNAPGEYSESIATESYELNDNPKVEIVVPPGQSQRRAATWSQLHSDLAAGKFRGIIFLVSYGYNSFMLSVKQHRLFDRRRKRRFITDYCAEQRKEELEILEELAPHVIAGRGKLWMTTLVAKQDLWWPKRVDVLKHYREGEYGDKIKNIVGKKGLAQFRHELALTSLVIRNFTSGAGEQLKPNAAGYDLKLQVESLRKMLEVIDGLREWESES